MPCVPHELQKEQGQPPQGAYRVQGSAFCTEEVAGDLFQGAGANDRTSPDQCSGFCPSCWGEGKGH